MSGTLTDNLQEIFTNPQEAVQGLSTNFKNKLTTNVASSSEASEGDTGMRAILSPLNPGDVFGSSPLLKILQETRGLIFPYTPTITFTQQVSYADVLLMHSNYDLSAYTRSPTATLGITGKFTVQNDREGLYALAALHFLRTASKMHFGEKEGAKAGLPPPVLLFSAYGTYMFNKLRCVLKSHSYTFDENMDTVLVGKGDKQVRIPAMFSLQCDLMIVQTPRRMRKEFNVQDFASGKLLEGGGWI